MKMRIMVPAVLALALTAAAIYSFARTPNVSAGNIVVTAAWARATPPGASVGAVYVTLENRGASNERLVSVASPAAKSAMLHETVEEGGISTMRESENAIAPGATLEMKPGSVHIMLMEITKPLKEGETVSVVLSFEKAGEVRVGAEVAPIGADGPMQAME
jgi:periplasmic copper chaperone A